MGITLGAHAIFKRSIMTQIALNNNIRLLSALWFAVTSLIPSIAIFVTFSDYTTSSYVFFLALPIAVAGYSGYRFGHHVIQGNKITNAKAAAIQGLYTVTASYIILSIIINVTMFILEGVKRGPQSFGINLLSFIFITIFGVFIFIPVILLKQLAIALAVGAISGLIAFIYKSSIKKIILLGIVTIIPCGFFFLWKLPNPTVIPMYPNAQVTNYVDFWLTNSGTAEQKSLTFQTDDSFETVQNYYNKTLSANGWIRDTTYSSSLHFYDLSNNYKISIFQDTDSNSFTVIILHSLLFSLFRPY